MSTQRILCPVDFSPPSAQQLRHALACSEGGEAVVFLLHTVEPLLLQAAAMSGGEQSLRDEIAGELRKVIAEATRTPGPPPVVETRVASGDPHTAILETCRHERCDLLVMGTHGAGGLAKAFFGSTLERVLRGTTVPVLARPPRAAGIVSGEGRLDVTHVIAAIDRDSPSVAATQTAAAWATRTGARLTLAHVMPAAPGARRWQAAAREEHARLRQQAEQDLARLVQERGQDGLTVASVVLEGSPAEQLAEYAGSAAGTLLVLGLGGARGGFSGRPGAVASRVLSIGRQPVLVVP